VQPEENTQVFFTWM